MPTAPINDMMPTLPSKPYHAEPRMRALAFFSMLCLLLAPANSTGTFVHAAWLRSTPGSFRRNSIDVVEVSHRPDGVGGTESFGQIPILYESDRLLIINKPPGIAHHNDRIQHDDDDDDDMGDQHEPADLGIVNLIRSQRGDSDQRLWGVHRLDRVTSGILILAKDPSMAQALTSSFAKGDIQKVYMGISTKRRPKKKQGWIQGGMVRSRNKSWKLTRDKTTTKNFARTRFFTAPIRCEDEQQTFTLLLFRPYTGKTHQLRVAAKAAGLPLWGDPIYKDGNSAPTTTDVDGEAVGMSVPQPDRTYLHASGILLPPLLDMTEPLAVWCPPPFEDVVKDGGNSIANLMQKHCDVPEILSAMKSST